ncbi:MAG: NAD-dependent epimerase/dehydratase family protein [Dehalococcoidia bacterium]|nr:NAD-dependent epimerase/dehydratase family protein [Dehalococcoidia bacterium]
MKALVTGATGFVGGHVARALTAHGMTVRVLARRDSSYLNTLDKRWEVVEGDIRDAASVRRAVEGCEAVFHVAALYAFWPTDVRPYYETNVVGTRNVLQAALDEGVQRVVHTSSWVTVGRPQGSGVVATEADLPRRGELSGAYRWTKYLAEQEALSFAARGLDVVVVNPTVPVGSGDARPTPTGRIIADFLRRRIPAYMEAQLNLAPVEDVAQGHLLAFQKGRKGERYLLGGRNMTLREMLSTLAALTGLPAPRLRAPQAVALAAAYVDDLLEGRLLRREPRIPLEGVFHAGRRVKVEHAKASRELGYDPGPVEAALARAVTWYREHGYGP